MRELVITELSDLQTTCLENALKDCGRASSIEHVYWLPLETADLTDIQRNHADCGPHALALEVLPGGLRLELLVRAQNRLHCQCVAICRPWQTARAVEKLNSLLAACSIDA